MIDETGLKQLVDELEAMLVLNFLHESAHYRLRILAQSIAPSALLKRSIDRDGNASAA